MTTGCPQCGLTKEALAQRDSEIFTRRWEGATFRQLAERFGVSAGRVQQVYNRELHRRCKADIGYMPACFGDPDWSYRMGVRPRFGSSSGTKPIRGESWEGFVARTLRNDRFVLACEDVAQAQKEADELSRTVFVVKPGHVRKYRLQAV